MEEEVREMDVEVTCNSMGEVEKGRENLLL